MARIIFTKTALNTLNELGFIVPAEMEARDFLAALRAIHSGADMESDEEDEVEGEPGEADDVAGEPGDDEVEGFGGMPLRDAVFTEATAKAAPAKRTRKKKTTAPAAEA